MKTKSWTRPGTCLVLLAAVLLSGCDDAREAAPAQDTSPAAEASRLEQAEKAVPGHLLFSPNGEPLNGGPLGRPTCGTAVKAWFARVDTNRDGFIGHDEFLSDAGAQFGRMDIDRYGHIVPEELARYRAPYRDTLAAAKPAPEKKDDAAESATPERHNGGRGHGRNARPEGYSDIVADPVMAADSNLDNMVSRQEFLAHAETNFAGLAKKDPAKGISLDEAYTLCR